MFNWIVYQEDSYGVFVFEKQDAVTFRLCQFSSLGQLEEKSSFQVDPIGCSLSDMSLLSIGECVFLVTKFGSFCAKFDDLLAGVLVPIATNEKISVFTHNTLLYHVDEQSACVQFSKLQLEPATGKARLISVGSGYSSTSDNTLVLQESDAIFQTNFNRILIILISLELSPSEIKHLSN